jgi:hypothetical protein
VSGALDDSAGARGRSIRSPLMDDYVPPRERHAPSAPDKSAPRPDLSDLLADVPLQACDGYVEVTTEVTGLGKLLARGSSVYKTTPQPGYGLRPRTFRVQEVVNVVIVADVWPVKDKETGTTSWAAAAVAFDGRVWPTWRQEGNVVIVNPDDARSLQDLPRGMESRLGRALESLKGGGIDSTGESVG